MKQPLIVTLKLTFILLLISLVWLVIKDWGQTAPYPLREFPCQFEDVDCNFEEVFLWPFIFTSAPNAEPW